MNDIPRNQNAEHQIRRLAAQRQLYSAAKSIFGVQALISGPIAVGTVMVALWRIELRPYAALWGISVAVADVVWLTPWQRRLKERAAKTQEAFDCELLDLKWNPIKTGSPVPPEHEIRAASKYFRAHPHNESLRDWYAPSVGELPLHLGRLVCQRINCWWDAEQRRYYAAAVGALLAIVLLAILAIGVVRGTGIDTLVVTALAPLLPAMVLGMRQIVEQLDAARRLDGLRKHAEDFWTDSLRHPEQSDWPERSRSLQDEIFDNRKKSPLVFDWIFNRLQQRFEGEMNHSAEEYVREAQLQLPR